MRHRRGGVAPRPPTGDNRCHPTSSLPPHPAPEPGLAPKSSPMTDLPPIICGACGASYKHPGRAGKTKCSGCSAEMVINLPPVAAAAPAAPAAPVAPTAHRGRPRHATGRPTRPQAPAAPAPVAATPAPGAPGRAPAGRRRSRSGRPTTMVMHEADYMPPIAAWRAPSASAGRREGSERSSAFVRQGHPAGPDQATFRPSLPFSRSWSQPPVAPRRRGPPAGVEGAKDPASESRGPSRNPSRAQRANLAARDEIQAATQRANLAVRDEIQAGDPAKRMSVSETKPSPRPSQRIPRSKLEPTSNGQRGLEPDPTRVDDRLRTVQSLLPTLGGTDVARKGDAITFSVTHWSRRVGASLHGPPLGSPGLPKPRSKYDPSQLKGTPSGSANLLYAVNAFNQARLGTRLRLEAGEFCFERTISLVRQASPKRLEAAMESLIKASFSGIEALKPIREGDQLARRYRAAHPRA